MKTALVTGFIIGLIIALGGFHHHPTGRDFNTGPSVTYEEIKPSHSQNWMFNPFTGKMDYYRED